MMKILLFVFIVGQCINEGMSFTCHIWANGVEGADQDCSRECSFLLKIKFEEFLLD